MLEQIRTFLLNRFYKFIISCDVYVSVFPVKSKSNFEQNVSQGVIHGFCCHVITPNVNILVTTYRVKDKGSWNLQESVTLFLKNSKTSSSMHGTCVGNTAITVDLTRILSLRPQWIILLRSFDALMQVRKSSVPSPVQIYVFGSFCMIK